MVETRSMHKERANGVASTSDTTGNAGYLSLRALAGLKQYQFKSAGLTWLDQIHQPHLNASVAALPMWLAPNLITLAGTLFVIAAHVLSILYLPEYQGDPLPRWLYYFFAASLVIYINLDCMDGKQARRTGTSNPLGQLFDHGCDALAIHLILDTVRTSTQLPAGWGAATLELAIMVPWMLAQWEEYHTGTMFYSNGWFGIMETIYALAITQLVTGIYGGEIWDKTVIPKAWLPESLHGLCVARHFLLPAVVVVGVCVVASHMKRVLTFSTASMPREEAGNKVLGHGAALLHLLYMSPLVLCGWIYLTATPVEQHPITGQETVKTRQKQLYWNPWEAGVPDMWVRWGQVMGHDRSVGLTWGVVYALTATQLILAHMICAYLDINCLTIKHKKAASKTQ